jgi:hypothetical protein
MKEGSRAELDVQHASRIAGGVFVRIKLAGFGERYRSGGDKARQARCIQVRIGESNSKRMLAFCPRLRARMQL